MSLLKPIETKTLQLRPGLHLLTYIKATDNLNPPIINIAIPIGLMSSRIAMLFLDANNEGFLNKPDDAVVIRVIGEAADLLVGIFITTECKSAEIQLKTEFLLENNQDLAVKSNIESETNELITDDDLSTEKTLQLSFSGHVEWQGDIQLAAGEGLGNPDKNWRIESFAIHWPNKPEGVDIEYRCYVKTLGETLTTLSNGFVGTKARALPITALSAQLTGLNAENYELTIQVIFSETDLRTITADGEFIWGIHEHEFLTGIRGFVKQKKKQKAINSSSTQNSTVENSWSKTDSNPTKAPSVAENTWANPTETPVTEKKKKTTTLPIQKNSQSNIISF